MRIGLLIVFIFWYSMLSLVYIAIPNDIQEGTINYDFIDELNTTVADGDVVDEVSILGSVGKFIAFVGFGFGLPDDTPFYFSVIMIFFNTLMSLLLVAWFIALLLYG